MTRLTKLICIMLFAIVIVNCNESRSLKKFAKPIDIKEFKMEQTIKGV
jgi:hypothetical protein